MQQSRPLPAKVRQTLTVAALAALAALLWIYQRPAVSLAVEEPQRRTTQRRPLPRPVATPHAAFKHETHREPKTKLVCSSCHVIPSRLAPDEIAAATKPSIKGFPYHDSCLECHRRTPPQFFRGATPSICTTCHTRSSPRLTKNDLFSFPRNNEQVMELEFPGYFPHDQIDHKRVKCADCHLTDDRIHTAIPVGGSESFKPNPGTFKTSPDGHTTCFKCHWEEKPAKDDCAGCHLTPGAVTRKKPEFISIGLVDWFTTWPRQWPKRITIKFNHETRDHQDDCVTCHDIAKLQTLDLPRVQVPMASCATCHMKPATPANIGKEMVAEDDDITEGRNNDPLSTTGKNACIGCHSTVIGSLPPPCSHYVLFDDTYFNTEDYPKSARQIAERCKK